MKVLSLLLAPVGESCAANFLMVHVKEVSLTTDKQTSVKAAISRTQVVEAVNLDARIMERYKLTMADGTLELELQYQRGVPTRTNSQQDVRFAAAPETFRNYRSDQLGDVVKDPLLGIDRLLRYQLRVTMPELADLFDGSEQLVSVIVNPWFLRRVFAPEGSIK